MTYDQWKCRDPNDTGFYDMPEDDGPTELDIAYQRIEALVKALEALTNAEALARVRGIVAGWNGEGREGGPFQRHPNNLGATLPKTRCKAVYDLDEALQEARRVLGAVGSPPVPPAERGCE